MRKVLGAVLILIGVFGIAAAIIFPTYVVSASKKTPLNLNITQRATGPGEVLNTSTNQIENVQLRATRIVRSDSTKNGSDSKYTTVDESLCIVVVNGSTPDCPGGNDPRRLSLTTDRVTTDRKSAEAVNIAKYGGNVNGDTSVQHSGMAYKFPIDTKKQTYQFFQTDVGKAYPATYQGTSKLAGLTVYEFISKTGDVPYKIQGVADGTYNDTRTVYVEPRTGAIIKGIEVQTQTLANGAPALKTTLTFDDASIKYQSDYAKNAIKKLDLAGIWAPIIFGIIGVAALIGAFFIFRGDRGAGDEPSSRHQANVPVDANTG